MAYSLAFQTALSFTLAQEGGFQNSPDDPGNWTGGAVGQGQLVGTNFGISAAAYPTLDIANLTKDQATAIYQSDYWDVISGDKLPVAMAIVTFDAAVNSGPGMGAKWLQSALGITADGVIGPETIAAAEGASDSLAVATEAAVNRANFLVSNGLAARYDGALLKRTIQCIVFAAHSGG